MRDYTMQLKTELDIAVITICQEVLASHGEQLHIARLTNASGKRNHSLIADRFWLIRTPY